MYLLGENFEGLGIERRMILKWIFKKESGGVDGIVLAEDSDMRRVVVNTVTNIRFRQNA